MEINQILAALNQSIENMRDQSKKENMITATTIKIIITYLSNELNDLKIDESEFDEKMEGIITYSEFAAGIQDNGKSVQDNIHFTNHDFYSLKTILSRFEINTSY